MKKVLLIVAVAIIALLYFYLPAKVETPATTEAAAPAATSEAPAATAEAPAAPAAEAAPAKTEAK